ncbi:MAG TPA: hypothetical protein VEI06_02830 [Gemmatimonadaceae bacterium]|nr:hypothetical protein [Gemmatimonadaceae bacterium]
MIIKGVPWELRQIAPGTEILITDERKRLVARGLLRADRRSLDGPSGEQISLAEWKDGWQLTVLRVKS